MRNDLERNGAASVALRHENVFARHGGAFPQCAAHRQVMQNAGIVAHIGQRGRSLREAREISMAAHFHQARIGFHRRVHGQGRENRRAALGRSC